MAPHKKSLGVSRKHKRGGSSSVATNASAFPQVNDYGSAGGWQLQNVGTVDQQFDKTFNQTPGVSNTGYPAESNAIRSLDGKFIAGGGRSRSQSRSRSRSRSKKGGYWSHVLKQAIVPFTLLGLQNRYKKKGGSMSMRTARRNRSRSSSKSKSRKASGGKKTYA
jgi:hypothetical protein